MRWLIRLFNIHPELVKEEIKTISMNEDIRWLTDTLAIITSSEERIGEMLRISTSIKFILKCPEIVDTSVLIEAERLSAVKIYCSDITIPEKTDFLVRFYQIGGSSYKHHTTNIERKLGSKILSDNPSLKVNLSNPKLKLYVVSWGSKSVLGWVYGENTYEQIGWREPKNSPYFRGGGMKARLCRILVNLLFPFQPVILDPFCGHGGILREIADLGMFAIGIEVSNKIIWELKENNRYFEYDELIAIILGDSLNAPLRKNSVRMAITDPPYAIQTTTKGINRDKLIVSWLNKQPKTMKVVFTTQSTMLQKLPDGWRTDLDRYDYVHKSLTRRARRIVKE